MKQQLTDNQIIQKAVLRVMNRGESEFNKLSETTKNVLAKYNIRNMYKCYGQDRVYVIIGYDPEQESNRCHLHELELHREDVLKTDIVKWCVETPIENKKHAMVKYWAYGDNEDLCRYICDDRYDLRDGVTRIEFILNDFDREIANAVKAIDHQRQIVKNLENQHKKLIALRAEYLEKIK